MAFDPTLNFSKGTLSTGYDDSAVEVVLESGHGAKFPDPSATGDFNVVWYNSTDYADPADDPNVEIVRVTDRTTDTLTITRAQESTTAKTHNTGGKTYKMILGPTAKTITDIDVAKANVDQTFYIGTTQVAINRTSAALTLAGITLTTPNIGTPSAGIVTNLTGTASININGTVGATTPTTGVFTTVTANTGLMPDTNDGAYLGQAGTAFSDLFLASGGVINWDSGDVTITHSANTLSFAGAVNDYSFTADSPTIYKTTLGSYFIATSAYDTETSGEPRLELHRSRGTIDSPTVVTAACKLGTILWRGYDGTNYESGASIQAYVDGTPGNDDMPGRLSFYTTPDGSKTLVERMRIDNAGVISAYIGIVPDANDGAYLGTTALGFSDLFLASGGVINWGNGNYTITHSAAKLTFEGGSTVFYDGSLTIVTDTVDTAGYFEFNFHKKRLSSPYTVQSGDGIGGVTWLGYDSDSYAAAARISAAVDGTPGDGDMPGRLSFWTTLDGSASLVERMRIDNAGVISAYVGIVPDANDGAYLGTGTLGFSDLFLASGGVINWANGNATITHSTGLLSFAGDAYFANDVGIGDSTPGYPLKIYSAVTDVTDKAQEIDFRPAITDNVTAYFIGFDILMSDATIASGKRNSGYNYGIFIRNYANNENFLGLLVDDIGLASAVGINICGAGGTITNAIGILARVLNADADGTVTNGTGLQVSNSQVTGTMTNRYGIVIDAMAGAGTLVKGISVGALSGTQVTKHGIDIGAISGASTTNYGLQIGNVSGATTNYSIYTGTGDIRLGGAVTLVTGVIPDADDGAYLGVSGTAFSDLFLASGAVINFAASDVTLTHASNLLTLGGGGFTVETGFNLMVGGATLEAGSTNTIGIANGTAPNASVANQIIIYSVDTVDATASLGLYLEQAVTSGVYNDSTHKVRITINGTQYYWMLHET